MKDGEILKYINGSTSKEEDHCIESWVKASKANLKKFNRIKATHLASTFHETSKEVDIEKALLHFQNNIAESEKNKYRTFTEILKYAAMEQAKCSLVIAISSSLYNSKFY